MDWLWPWVQTGLPMLPGLRSDSRGDLFYAGERLGPGSHRHGSRRRKSGLLEGARAVARVLRTQRWLAKPTGRAGAGSTRGLTCRRPIPADLFVTLDDDGVDAHALRRRLRRATGAAGLLAEQRTQPLDVAPGPPLGGLLVVLRPPR